MMINKLIVFISLFVTVNYAFAAGVTIALAVGLTAGTAAFAVTAVAINFALSYVISQILAPNFGAQSGQQQDQGVRVQVPPDTTTTIPMIYGTANIGGKFVDACLREDQRVMYYVMAISCKSDNGTVVANTTQMYYGDRLIGFDLIDTTKVISLTDTAGNVDTKINNFLFINLYVSDSAGNVTSLNGAPMPWADATGPDGTSRMMGVNSGLPLSQQWPATGRRMNGLVWAMIRLSYNQEAETTSLQPITFNITQHLYGKGVAVPGDVWYDYMRDTVYGAGIPAEDIDDLTALTLNAYSDQLITFNDYNGVPQTQSRYRINGVVDASKGILENVDQILIASDSWMQYNAPSGKWAIVVNKAESPSYYFTDSNIVGSIIVGSVDITQMPNQIQGKFPDKTNRDQYNYVNLKTPTLLLYPNEPVNKINVNYDLVNDSVQALYLANRTIEQAREDLLVTINTTYDGIQVDAGDVVSVTNTAYGWNNKLFRAMQVKEIAETTGLTAQIQLIEYNSAVYDNFDITQYIPAGNSDTPSAGFFSALSQPAVVDSFPYEATPTFDINVAIPNTGRVTLITLFYTTVASPTSADWQVLDTQSLANSVPFDNGSVITFTDYNLAPANYYFAYKVSNDVSSSILSPASNLFNWNPDPANASTFLLTLNPVTLQVPFDGTTANLTGINFRLFGSNGLGPVQYVTSATDADAAFVAGTWRIGGSSTTGTADIVQTGITFPLPPTDGGTYAQFGTATAMASSPATIFIPVRYKDLAGEVRQVSPATLQAVYAQQGQQGNKTATAYLYQWSATTPANPSGTSIFSWATGGSSSYTGGGGWTTTAPANPGVPLIKLWVAQKIVTDVFDATTTSVSWTSGFSIIDSSQNGATGASGVQQADAIVYQWALTIPAAPIGTSTYTWATGLFTAPSGWSLSKSTSPSAGFTLWQAKVSLTDSVTATTTTISWTTSQITAAGYVGATGVTTVSCFTATSITLNPFPTIITTSGESSLPPINSWAGANVRLATTVNLASISGLLTIDGVVTVAGDRVLVKNQSTQANNGIYVVSSGSWTRASDADTWNEFVGLFVYVSAGSTQTGTRWNSTAVAGGTLGVTAITFTSSATVAPVWGLTVPTTTAGQTVWQSDGIYNPTTGNIVWNVPYISSVRFGSLSAISANLGQVTSGLITGATIRTAATGARLVLSSGNLFEVYNSSGILAATIFGGVGESGTVWAASQSATGPGIVGQSNFNTRPGVYGYQDSLLGGYGVVGYSFRGDGVLGQSQAEGVALNGLAYVSGGSNNHGIRGQNISQSGGGVATAGLVGVGNGYDFYAEGGGINYGPFTGSHDVLTPIGANFEVGYIVVDITCIARKNISNTIFEVALSSSANQVSIGIMAINNGLLSNSQPAVFIESVDVIYENDIPKTVNVMTEQYEQIKNDYDYCAVNAVGEGQVMVCGENGNIAQGDLIVTSSVAGVGMKQSDNIVTNITVAKAREAVTFTDTTTPKLVACIYLCG